MLLLCRRVVRPPGPWAPKMRRLAVGKEALRTGIILARWGSFVVGAFKLAARWQPPLGGIKGLLAGRNALALAGASVTQNPRQCGTSQSLDSRCHPARHNLRWFPMSWNSYPFWISLNGAFLFLQNIKIHRPFSLKHAWFPLMFLFVINNTGGSTPAV